MACSQSEPVAVVVFMLQDGASVQVPEHDSEGIVYECGDLVDIDVNLGDGEEPAVVLGCAFSQEEALQKARSYLRRLAKWHGVQKVSELKLFGRELSQSQIVQDIEEGPLQDDDLELSSSLGAENSCVQDLRSRTDSTPCPPAPRCSKRLKK